MAAGDGLVSMAPTSIAYSGTSAGINADGGVDFSAVTSLSLNGVFTSAYDNYLISIGGAGSGGSVAIQYRLRASGSDASGTDYTYQSLSAASTTVSGARTSSTDFGRFGLLSSNLYGLIVAHLYGPYLAQPTASRGVTGDGQDNARIFDYAATHSLSTSYDGVTLSVNANAVTGNVHVFGYEE
jgi:hypothetical protein